MRTHLRYIDVLGARSAALCGAQRAGGRAQRAGGRERMAPRSPLSALGSRLSALGSRLSAQRNERTHLRYRDVLFYLFLTLLTGSLAASPRLDALGGVYATALPGTEGLGGNPAAIAGGEFHQISANGTRYWLGLPGDILYGSRLAYTTPAYKWGSAGLELRQFGLGIHSRFDIGLGYAYPFRLGSSTFLSAGVYGHWIRNRYDLSSAYRFEDDPLFGRYGETSDGFGMDAGLDFRFRKFSVGLAGRNLIEPSLSLSGGTAEGEAAPLEISAGLAYSPFKWFTPTIQGGWHELEGFQGAAGAEFRLFDGLLGRLHLGLQLLSLIHI